MVQVRAILWVTGSSFLSREVSEMLGKHDDFELPSAGSANGVRAKSACSCNVLLEVPIC